MKHDISREFTFRQLLRFALPTIIMMMFLSLYTIVDGLFIARFVGTEALSANNLVYPLICVNMAVALMFATGGSAVVSRQMGEGRMQEARENFTLVALATILLSALLGAVILLFMEPIVRALGADEALLPLCRRYLTILSWFAPVSALQMLFQSFFVVAGKPTLGLTLTITAGLLNIVLDYVFIVPMGMGIFGAALATALGYCVPGIGGLLYFARKRAGLCFAKPAWRGRVLGQSAYNGASEMVANLSLSIVTLLFNLTMLRFAGSDGVAAITVILYCQFLMTSLFLGFSLGVAPVFGFHYGAQNQGYLKKLLRMCVGFIAVASVAIFLGSVLGAGGIAHLFAPRDSAVYALVAHGMRVFSISFLFAGVNIFASALFTALSNGRVSAIISFSRTFLFTLAGILLLSHLFQVEGVWLAVPFAEGATVLLVCCFTRTLRTRYGIL
nr:MATE family efflux transporter [Maliibacterium massiliense]